MHSSAELIFLTQRVCGVYICVCMYVFVCIRMCICVHVCVTFKEYMILGSFGEGKLGRVEMIGKPASN